ncbi:MAG: hypothetical protein LUD78_01985 [Clostridiales bacterium]|nr:hypothetical protein [Clostridiales bacterium]
MSKKLDLTDKLDFSEIDLTAPNKVVEGILAQLSEETRGMVSGEIVEYHGPVVSYINPRGRVTGTVFSESKVDIQKSLGILGGEYRKYECVLYSAGYDKYKYRLFFMKYSVAAYPVQLTVEESIARSIQDGSSNYIFTCNNREEMEDLVIKILNSGRVVNVMQEFIRIYQANQLLESEENIVDDTDIE